MRYQMPWIIDRSGALLAPLVKKRREIRGFDGSSDCRRFTPGAPALPSRSAPAGVGGTHEIGAHEIGRGSLPGSEWDRMTDGINGEALAGLTAAAESFLPDIADPSVRLILLAAPVSVAPTGLGGFIAANEDPEGEILGRRLDATALLTVRANDVGPLNGAVAAVIRSFLGADRAALVEQGILRVSLEEVGPQSISGSGNTGVAERTLTFKVLYEFLKRPEESEDVIVEIPMNLDTT